MKERKLSLRFGTQGSFKVERRRTQYKHGMPWWSRELRVLASIPVIVIFAGLLSAILTSIFLFEAFVTQLYQGPGKQLIVRASLLAVFTLINWLADVLSYYSLHHFCPPSPCRLPSSRSSVD